MKMVFMAMGLMALLMVGGGGFISMIFASILGGNVAQSYIYPIYGAIIALTGVVVGATQMVIYEIKELKQLLKDHKLED